MITFCQNNISTGISDSKEIRLDGCEVLHGMNVNLPADLNAKMLGSNFAGFFTHQGFLPILLSAILSCAIFLS
jgi:hypothetical protein